MRIGCISISLSMVPVDAHMKKLHAIMPMFSETSAKLETALEHGDAVAAEAEAGKITAAIPDLRKSNRTKISNSGKTLLNMHQTWKKR